VNFREIWGICRLSSTEENKFSKVKHMDSGNDTVMEAGMHPIPSGV